MIGTLYSEEVIQEYSKIAVYKTMFDFWDDNAQNFPDKEAIIDSTTRLTWKQSKIWIDRLAMGLLDLGIGRDEVMVFQLPSIVEMNMLRLACEKAGILSLAIIPRLREREVRHILKTLNAVGVVIPKKFRGFDYHEMIHSFQPELPQLKYIFTVGTDVPDGTISINELISTPIEKLHTADYLDGKGYRGPEVSYIMSTTGTTGFPKFVEYPAWARPTIGKGMVERLKLTANDTVGIFTPIFGGPTLIGYYAAPQVVARTVLLESFEPAAALKLIEREKITVVTGVNTVMMKMFLHPDWAKTDLSSVRLWYMMGNLIAIAPEVEKRGGKIINVYGTADCGANCVSNFEDPMPIRCVTCGKPVYGATYKIMDHETGREVWQGEIGEPWGGNGPACATGYYHDPETNKKAWTSDGRWYKTGDLAKKDADGNLIFVGRTKDMVKRGGQNVYPVEIEELLLGHPKIAQVAIVGMPDPILGEACCAYVVPYEGETFTFQDMVSFLKDAKVATYKIPERLEIVDKLPMASEDLKVNKNALREDILNKLKAEGKISSSGVMLGDKP